MIPLFYQLAKCVSSPHFQVFLIEYFLILKDRSEFLGFFRIELSSRHFFHEL
jgi:hypothetical protein